MVGKIDPLFTEPRQNKYGWYLLVTGVIFLFVAFLGSADAVIPSYYFALLIALALLMVVAGLRLLIKHHSGGSRMKKCQQK
ncbi:MAG TPA: hypothetical protein VLM38_20320 [Blastocatellia bacterium]|nr:hypothetical protein [Blastocatellia bacterium]